MSTEDYSDWMCINLTNYTNCSDPWNGAGLASDAAPIAVFYGLITIIGFLGNSMVILVVLKEKKMRNTTNVFVFSLSIADLSFIIICTPFTAADHMLGQWIFGQVMCKLFNYFTFVNVYASIYTLTVMSFDRFLAVVYPIRTMKFRRTRYAIISVIVLWIVILITLSPLLVVTITEKYKYIDGQVYTSCHTSMNMQETRIFIGQFFVTSYAFPLTVISLTYFLMLRSLWSSAAPSSNISEESAKRKRKVTVMVVVVVIVFAICWLPIQIFLMVQNFAVYDYENPVLKPIYYTANCMSYANSCINPIIYVFLSKSYRQAFRRAICCCVQKQRTTRGGFMRDSMMVTTAVSNTPNRSANRHGAGKYIASGSQRNSSSSSHSVTHSSPRAVCNRKKGNEYLMTEVCRTRAETKPLFGESSASDTGSNPSEITFSEEERSSSKHKGDVKQVAKAITKTVLEYCDDSDASSVDMETNPSESASPAKKSVEFVLREPHRVGARFSSANYCDTHKYRSMQNVDDIQSSRRSTSKDGRYVLMETSLDERRLIRNRATLSYHHS
uniref:Allatostatin-A receptor-like n=1 Tax=Saccoglossus kowalevskii TaxID=10224 RepID=A0ABM0GV72_SACKO|nr:PREDICTED: allatostatin-A receptor-like [Saccoglossus kowalevskii]